MAFNTEGYWTKSSDKELLLHAVYGINYAVAFYERIRDDLCLLFKHFLMLDSASQKVKSGSFADYLKRRCLPATFPQQQIGSHPVASLWNYVTQL